MSKRSKKSHSHETLRPSSRPRGAARRDAPRDSGAEAAHRRAADERAFGRAYRACRAADDSARTADHRRDAGKARSRSTVWIRATADRPGRRGDGRRAYDDAARRSAGAGPADQAQRRTRSLSRLWAGPASRPGRVGAAPPRRAASAIAGGEFGGRRGGRKIIRPAKS